jgi:hypothetical protein
MGGEGGDLGVGLTVTLNLFQGPVRRPLGARKLDAETRSA